MFEFEDLESSNLIDERFTEVFYNGCIPECEDPYDYITTKEATEYAGH